MDDVLFKHLSDLARGAFKRGDARFSRFLDPAERAHARRAAAEAGVQAAFYGGYPDAERAVCAFYMADAPDEADWPVVCVRAAWDARFGEAAHRDLLGAEMALGLDRACLGDIAMGKDAAYLFALEDAARYLEGNLTGAGRCKLQLMRVDGPGPLAEPDGCVKRITVGSMRLDAVVSGAYNLSRSEAQRLIARELVKLNHVPEVRADARVRAGDLISARGYGRAKLLHEAEETRKGRLALQLMVYGG
ncbi:YlmH/Sll1252 family protein [Bacillota bacterium Meth-B3]